MPDKAVVTAKSDVSNDALVKAVEAAGFGATVVAKYLLSPQQLKNKARQTPCLFRYLGLAPLFKT